MRQVALLFSLFVSFTLYAQVEWQGTLVHNFQRAVERNLVQHTFKVKNISNTPIILIVASGQENRECKVASFTQQPVLPQKFGQFTIQCHFSHIDHGSESYRRMATNVHISSRGQTKSYDLVMSGYVIDTAAASGPNTCGVARNCQAARKRRLCFYNVDTRASNIGASLEVDCQGMETHAVYGVYDVIEVLRQIRNSCDTIGELKFTGHGHPEGMDAGYEVDDIHHHYKDYACLMDKDAEIKLYGCNTGRGCNGKITMYEWGQVMLSKRGGKVYGHSTVSEATTTFGDVSPILSRRVYTVTPNTEGAWGVTGSGLTENLSLAHSCVLECSSIIRINNTLSDKECLFISSAGKEIISNCAKQERTIANKTFMNALKTNVSLSYYTPNHNIALSEALKYANDVKEDCLNDYRESLQRQQSGRSSQQ